MCSLRPRIAYVFDAILVVLFSYASCHRPISDAADFWYRARAPLILVASEYMSDMSGALMFQTVGVDSYVSESVDSYSSLVSATGPDSADIDVGPVR